MDDATTSTDIRLREGASIAERLGMSAFAAAVALMFTPALFSQHTLQIIISVVVLLIVAGFVVVLMFAPAVVWIITPGAILIGRQRPFGRLRTRAVARDDIEELQVRSDSGSPKHFAVYLRLASGDQLKSPPIADVTRVNETSRRIAELLGTSPSTPPPHPLDASNAEIRIGRPVQKSDRAEIRTGILTIASLCTIFYVLKLWMGPSPSLPDILLLPIGIAVAFFAYRYVHRFDGESWIVGQGKIRVERLSRDGELSAVVITGRDIKSISVEQPDDESNYLVAVELHSGRKIRSPDVGTKTEARAVTDEIVRRLEIAPERVRR